MTKEDLEAKGWVVRPVQRLTACDICSGHMAEDALFGYGHWRMPTIADYTIEKDGRTKDICK